LTQLDLDAVPEAGAIEAASVGRPRIWSAHPAVVVFVGALVLRLAVSGLLLAGGHWPVAPDERQYIDLAQVVASGHPASDWDPAWGDDLFAQTATFLVPLTWLFRLFGAHVFFGMLLAALAGAATAALTVRLATEVGMRSWALPAGGLVALLPSQVLWSSLVLREAPVWATLAGLALLLAVALRTTGARSLTLLGVAIVADLFLLFHLRPYVFVVACWAMVVATLIGVAARRLVTPVGAVGVMLALPALCGIGVGGITLVSTNLPFLAAIQAHLAIGADSAIVKPKPVPSPGTGKRAAPVDDSGGAAAGPRHILRGVVAVTLRPFPWERPTSAGAALAQVENLGWVLLYALAGIGAWVRRRDRRVIAFPVVFIVGYVLMSALFEGNVGTAFRHRGQIAWALVLLSACGIETALVWIRSRAGRRPA
jgi:hypothetical protein